MDTIKNILNIPKIHTDISAEILDENVVGGYVLERLSQLIFDVLDFSADSISPSLLGRIETLLLYAWQELNTGKWSDVNVNWHKLYAAVSWLKAVTTYRVRSQEPDQVPVWMEVIKICDMGHLMGGDVWNDVLIRTISNVENSGLAVAEDSAPENTLSPPKLKRSKLLPTLHHPLPIIDLPSLSTFKSSYLIPHHPVIIRDCLTNWPALTKWSPDYLRRLCGSRTVPVEIGRRYTDDDWTQQLMTISTFIDTYINNPNNDKIAYLAQHDLFTQAPTLKDDIFPPDYIAYCGDDQPDTNAWFGPEGTVSPLHYDPKENFLCQVMGEKYVRLYGEDQSDKLYSHESTMLKNTSQVDVENVDEQKFPLAKDAVYGDCILAPGDMLFIPARCWHFVRSLSVSFSVSFWFKCDGLEYQ